MTATASSAASVTEGETYCGSLKDSGTSLELGDDDDDDDDDDNGENDGDDLPSKDVTPNNLLKRSGTIRSLPGL